jgi:hypothetical protein
MTSAKKAASIAARSTVRARSIHRSRSFNSAWRASADATCRAWRVVFMAKGEYAGVWRGVSGSFHSDGVSQSRGRPPDSYAWSALSSVSARATSRAPSGVRRRQRARRPSCPRRRGSHRPCASSRRENSPAQFSLGSKPIVAGSRPAVSNSASGPIVRESLWSWVFRPPTPTMVRFE